MYSLIDFIKGKIKIIFELDALYNVYIWKWSCKKSKFTVIIKGAVQCSRIFQNFTVDFAKSEVI